MTHDEMIAVIQADKDGKEIQYRMKHPSYTWYKCEPVPMWNFCECDYRVKPKPREFWVLLAADNAACTVYDCMQEACTHAEKYKLSMLEVREVIK
jgi:hypothetical protein